MAAAPCSRIAVIGAGWSGVVAAVELCSAGHSVTLYEAGRRPGGRARTVEIDGRTLDNGQHILLGAYRDTLALMRRIGLRPDKLLERRPLAVQDNKGFSLTLPRLPAPFNLAWGLVTARGVSLTEKLATARWMELLKGHGFRLAQDMTVSQWLTACPSPTLARRLFEPLCLAALNTPPGEASAQVFANVLRDSLGSPRRADTDLLIPRVPLGSLLPEPACAWLANRGAELRFSHRVQSLVQESTGGVKVDGQGFDKAVVAVAPQHANLLYPGLAPDYRFQPIATVYLQQAEDYRLPFPLIALTGGVGQWVVDRGNGLLAAIQSGQGAWTGLSDNQLAKRLEQELELPAPSRWHKVIREQRATFSCTPGLTRPGTATAYPDILRAGDYAWADYPATLEGAVRSGRAAAMACLGQGFPASG